MSSLWLKMKVWTKVALFALVSGLVAPMLFDSALKLACGVLAGLVASFACWRLSRVLANPVAQPA